MSPAPKDPYRYFRIEARELLDQMASGIAAAEHEGPGGSQVARLLRLAHTLKGAARVVRVAEVADRAHAIEGVLAPFRDAGTPAIPREVVEALLAHVDAAGARVAGLDPPAAEAPAPSSARVHDTVPMHAADAAEMDALLDALQETRGALGALRDTTSALARGHRLARAARERLAGAGADPGVRRAVEELHDLLAGLEHRTDAALGRVGRELDHAYRDGERLRLVPVSALFAPVERVVHDTARALGLRVRFEARGAAVRLDGPVLSELQRALVQAARNAVAHGLEPAPERHALGKPPEGRVALAVVARGPRVVVTCRDDGRGIDLPAVRAALTAKGRLDADASDDAVLRALLAGSVSTASGVTDAAGRGVGLDVVAEAAARLGGRTRLLSTAGAGTTLELVVPVSLAALEAVVLESGDAVAAVPVAAVRRTLRLGEHGADVPRPLFGLAQLLGVAARGAPRAAAVVGGAGGPVAVGVDRVRGCESLLVQAVPKAAPVDPVVLGLFFDRDGQPRPVLDPDRLAERAARCRTPTAPPPSAARPAPILVVDDSLTTRMLEQSILESAGYEVEVASSAEEALAKTARRRYALFLVDVEMPGMDGFALLERFRGDPELREVPALLVTSRGDDASRARGAAAGARGYVVKSEFDQAELLERIRGLVG